MIEVHFLVPPPVVEELSSRFAFEAKNGKFGYFTALTEDELMAVTRALIRDGYRVDVKPGDPLRLMAAKA